MAEADSVSANETGAAAHRQKVLLASGTSVNVQRAGSDVRVPATILGSVPEFYIALRDPHHGSNERSLRSLNLLIADVVILRFLHDGVIYGFRSSVSRLTTDPEYLLFVHYPQDVEHVSVRQAPRISFHLPCEVSFGGGGSQPGLVLDLSPGGCAVAGARNEGSSSPREADPVTLSLTLPAQSRPVQAVGRVRRVSAEGGNWKAGIAFDDEHTQLVAALEPYLRLAPVC